METSRTKARWSSRHGDTAYWAGFKKLEAQRAKFLRETEGCRVHRIDLQPFPGRIEPKHGIDIYDHSRRLLAEAPDCWPHGASPFDVIETYTSSGTLSMYAVIGQACQWQVREHRKRGLQLIRWRRVTAEDRERLDAWKASNRAQSSSPVPEMVSEAT